MNHIQHLNFMSDLGFALGTGNFAKVDQLIAQKQDEPKGQAKLAKAMGCTIADDEERGAEMDMEQPGRFEME